jgi:hypothetical protein
VGDGLCIANALSDSGGLPKAGLRYSIHDVIIDDLNAAKYGGNGTFAQVSMDKGVPVLQDVTINHVTAFPSNAMLVLGDDIKVNPPMNNFVFTNNIVNGPYPVLTTGGGPVNCAYYNTPLIALGACFEPYTFSHNAVIATKTNFPPSKFPSDNFFPATAAGVDFVNYNAGNGGDYHLQSSSPYKNAAMDGKDLGADVSGLMSAIAGVK